LSIFLVLFHFVFPFLLLLSREAKRNAAILGVFAFALLTAHLGAVYWLVIPSVRPFAFYWTDPLCFIGVGGIWLAAWSREWRRRAIARAAG